MSGPGPGADEDSQWPVFPNLLSFRWCSYGRKEGQQSAPVNEASQAALVPAGWA